MEKSNSFKMQERDDAISSNKKRFQLHNLKNNTICSLQEVEFFLNRCNKTFKCIKICKLLK